MLELKALPAFLEGRARINTPITYNELAKQFGQERVTPENYRGHAFHEVFGLMDEQDIEAGRPLRTAIAYSAVLNRPGQGFFKTLEKARHMNIHEDDEMSEWMSELKRLQAALR